jgi:hypothetical protein
MLLILELLAMIAAGLVLIYLLADRAFSAPRYQGPVTNHFDGRRFRNLEPPARKDLLISFAGN